MSTSTASPDDEIDTLDVRDVPKPQRHPLIFQRFASLTPATSFVLVNSHDPKHLRDEFNRDHWGSYDWQYLETGPVWRIRITRLTSTDLPRILCDTHAVTALGASEDGAGAVWKLEVGQRQLDANVIHLQPHARIETHLGPDLDVLMHVLNGEGLLTTETDNLNLSPGSLVWLPRRSRRSISAGATGLSYLTVHPRRPGLTVGVSPTQV